VNKPDHAIVPARWRRSLAVYMKKKYMICCGREQLLITLII